MQVWFEGCGRRRVTVLGKSVRDRQCEQGHSSEIIVRTGDRGNVGFLGAERFEAGGLLAQGLGDAFDTVEHVLGYIAQELRIVERWPEIPFAGELPSRKPARWSGQFFDVAVSNARLCVTAAVNFS